MDLEVADSIGRLMQFWGFKRAMGRTWALLFLSPEPARATDLADRLKMSPGAVSMTLAELLKWGAVRKCWRPGERSDFYEAETSVWKMVRRVIRERELVLVREVGDVLERAETALKPKSKGAGGARSTFKRERIGQLRSLAKVGERLLSSLAAGESVDPSPLRDVVGGN